MPPSEGHPVLMLLLLAAVTSATPLGEGFGPAPYDTNCQGDWGYGDLYKKKKERVEECWKRGEVVHFTDFKCYTLHSQGRCGAGERIVYTKAICPTTTCRTYTDSSDARCTADTVTYDGLCRDPSDPAVCESVRGRRLLADFWGDYTCSCSSALGFLEVEGSCWPRYLQGPCREGEQVARNHQGEGVCRPDPCVAVTNTTSKRGFFLGPGEVCHHLSFIYTKFALPNATMLFTQEEISLVKGDARFQKPLEEVTASRVPCAATHCTCKQLARTNGECLLNVIQDPNRFDENVDFLKNLGLLFEESTLVKEIQETVLIEAENNSDVSFVVSEFLNKDG